MIGLFVAVFKLPAGQAPPEREWQWIEGEQPVSTDATRHPWYANVQSKALSGGAALSHFNDDRPAVATYRFDAGQGGSKSLWLRANPTQASLQFQLNGSEWTDVPMGRGRQAENIAADGGVDLRFVAWIPVGPVSLRTGENELSLRFISERHHHGLIDCIVFAAPNWAPDGLRKPGEAATSPEQGWFVWRPERLPSNSDAKPWWDLRYLNEDQAGDVGRIAARNGRFIHSRTGEPARFWGVNGPSGTAVTFDDLRYEARLLASYGVNLVRSHGPVFDDNGSPDPEKIQRVLDIVETMKSEGIYTHLSIYFPLWMRPKPGTEWLEGYDGSQHPFAALMFNPDFQERYRSWWRALLLTPSKRTGRRLVDDPAIFGAEIQNEDSFFFWTFAERNLPEPQLAMLESQFAEWLSARYESPDRAITAWGGMRLPRDVPDEGRMGFRPLWNLFNEKTARDIDTARFLLEKQTTFYRETKGFLRSLGFKGLVQASNWHTASAEILTPLERLSYLEGDFMDRHGYFACAHQGDNASWSIRDGQTFVHRSALRFDPLKAGQPRLFGHPVMDPHYNDRPSMISETTWNRPNRYRVEAPIVYAAYGALQDTDAIVHFAFDGPNWSVKPGYWMQPWTLASPTQLGQFPATALAFRKGLISVGDLAAKVNLHAEDLIALKGSPLIQEGSLDELRLRDVTGIDDGASDRRNGIVDPRVHYVGRTRVTFDGLTEDGRDRLMNYADYIDEEGRRVQSNTGELALDYQDGTLRLNSPALQGITGNLQSMGKVALGSVTLESPMDPGAILVVAMDGKPLEESRKILIQAMSEEKPTGFQSIPRDGNRHEIVDIGRDPWLVRELEGRIRLHRPDASKLRVIALDSQGLERELVGFADEWALLPDKVYYAIQP